MKAIYLAQGQTLEDNVVNINGVPGAYGTLMDLVLTDNRFCWTQWSCCDAIATIDTSISSMIMNGPGGVYTPTAVSLIGGRPPRPIAK